MGASVKIMLSYDYCHFEVCKSTDQVVTDEQIDEMRKDVQRLADKAVKQYKIAKEHARKVENLLHEKENHERRVKRILDKPEDTWTPEEKAYIKQSNDKAFLGRFTPLDYDYEDDYDEDWYEEEPC